ncbi:APMAP [Mytilus coruscus]|uniref:APMAP n=1 Tax=Mytilus coruscus TaxID=42192 RepID=A0A6J8EVP4_MYTCO|nr:APMAP [Mytilus coruscus]
MNILNGVSKSWKILTVLVVFAAYLYMLPSPIDPPVYRYPKPPVLKGALQKNSILHKAEQLFKGQIVGPESFTGNKNGTIFTGLADGRVVGFKGNDIWEITRFGKKLPECGSFQLEPICGRPKGMKIDNNGDLLVLDSYTGLYKVKVETGEKELLVSSAKGFDNVPFKFLNGLDIDSEGMIYFTDSSTKWDRRNYRYEVMELRNTGRFLRYNPDTGELKLLMDNMYLPNGVAITADEKERALLMNRYDSDDNLALFHDTYMPRNYESEDAEFNELLSLIPTINTPNNSVPLANQPGIFIRDSDAIMEKLAACRKFGGYPHENASVFMKEFTSFATLHKIDHADDQRMIAAFHLNLTGPALTWFNSLDAGSKRTWRQFLAIFDEKYIELDWQSPTVFLESENFQNMKLNRGQILEDFYGQIVEKAQILKKKDHEILSQFIKGLPEQLAFFVRAGTHKDSASALSAAKMGEAYGYRKDDVVCVAAAKPLVANDNNPVQELQNQVKELTKALSELKSHSTDIKPGMPPKYQNLVTTTLVKQ